MQRTGSFGLARSPVFIGGLMKSGTSLLRVLMGQHPNFFASFESHWFLDAVRTGWDDPTIRRVQYLIQFFELGDGEYRALCDAKRKEPNREFIDILLESCARAAGRKGGWRRHQTTSATGRSSSPSGRTPCSFMSHGTTGIPTPVGR